MSVWRMQTPDFVNPGDSWEDADCVSESHFNHHRYHLEFIFITGETVTAH